MPALHRHPDERLQDRRHVPIEASQNPDLVTIRGDIGDPETGKRVIDEAMSRFGRVDTLVNNAGIFIGGAFTAYTQDQYRAMLPTNLDGFLHVTQHAVVALERQGSGHIVQMTTTLVFGPDA